MSRVIAAIDNSAAAKPVLSAAAAVAKLFDAKLEAIHAKGTADTTMARTAAKLASVRLRVVTGEPAPTIVRIAESPDVVALVLGARGTPGGRRPAGHIATEVAVRVAKPVIVVPPECACPVQLRRILVPIEPDMVTATALRQTVEAACAAGVEVIVLHVFEERELPLFTEQPQHEVEAWVSEFVRRYCSYLDVPQVELRAGVPSEHLLEVADGMRADALVLGWGQHLAVGRAAMVRAALERSKVPVILVPVRRGTAN